MDLKDNRTALPQSHSFRHLTREQLPEVPAGISEHMTLRTGAEIESERLAQKAVAE